MMEARIKGARKLEALLDKLPKRIEDDIQRAVTKGAHEVADAQRLLAPVETGDLRDSIAVTGPGQRTPSYSMPGGARVVGRLEAVVTAGNGDVRYAHLVEYGTQKTDAQPYFWPGYRSKRERVKRRIKRETSKAVRKEAGL